MPRHIDEDAAEADVKQEDLRERFAFDATASLIRIVADWSSRTRQQDLSEMAGLEVSPDDIPTLFILGTHEPLRPGELAEKLRVSPAGATRTIQRLHANGVAVRVPDPDDARAARVTLTDEGVDAVRALFESGDTMMGRIFEGWTDQERESFEVLLRRFADALERE